MYSLPNEELWTGRVDNDPTSLRYHEIIQFDEGKALSSNGDKKTFSIIGFECDEGVRRNQGQVGAKLAPEEIRKFLANLPFHHTNDEVIDVGNVMCKHNELEKAQQTLGNQINTLLEKSTIPIIIGGGHETLYGHYLGVRQFIGKEASLGIINIDAHFDLRNDKIASSGTMFHQILSGDENAQYLCLGIQKLGNTKELFDAANKFQCEYILEDNIYDRKHTSLVIDEFAQAHDVIILTLCMDSIASSAAPGVSAPSPYGLEPKAVRDLLLYIAKKDNLLSFDLSEVNPLLDENSKTARLAAHLFAEVMQNYRS